MVARASVGEGMRPGNDRFAGLYESLAPGVYRYCLARLRHVQDAEDATEQTFLQALAAFARFTVVGGQDPTAWLFRIAANVVTDRLRSARRRPTAGPAPEEYADSGEGTEATAVRRIEALALWDAVAALPPSMRSILALRFAADLPVADVAAVIGKTPGATRTELWRALRRLRQTLPAAQEEEGLCRPRSN